MSLKLPESIPFALDYCDAGVADLKDRLARSRWPAGLPGPAWECGADIDYLRDLCEYWRDEFDWRSVVDRLNRIPQFCAVIDGLPITYWHVRSADTTRPAIPLLLLHGWPGSQIEFEALISPLTVDASTLGSGALSFDIVVPALPGFGFGGKPAVPGWGADRVADAFHTLMTQVLNYPRFGVQGGDWGTLIGTRLAHRHPASLVGLHINMPYALPLAGAVVPAEWQKRMEVETGYLHLQNTKPDTLTLGLSDSPVALAAWIIEKFRAWSDCDGHPENAISRDVLLANLMFYWLSNSAASAARLYFESTRLTPPLFQTGRISVPTGVAVFPKEPYQVPRAWLDEVYPITHWTNMLRGGHFPALEQPVLLVEDIRTFFAGTLKGFPVGGHDLRGQPAVQRVRAGGLVPPSSRTTSPFM